MFLITELKEHKYSTRTYEQKYFNSQYQYFDHESLVFYPVHEHNHTVVTPDRSINTKYSVRSIRFNSIRSPLACNISHVGTKSLKATLSCNINDLIF